MNEMKVNMVKFLMTMFESSADSLENIKTPQVRLFKNNVDELVRRNQIPNSVRNLIYNIYGIVNTDVFKPEMQSNKLMQINMLMMQLGNIITVGNASSLTLFKKNVENGVKQGSILKSARDIVFEIYDLEEPKVGMNTVNKNTSMPSDIRPAVKPATAPKSTTANKPENKEKKSKDVLADISKFKSQFVPEIYYEYPNPNFDGCSGSLRDAHIKLIDAKTRPEGATFVIYKMIRDDGCHQSYGYFSVPKEYYKPTPAPATRINTPTTGTAVGCTGGSYSMRTC